MDLSGRFDFWRMLLHTRAITPPRAAAKLWRSVAKRSSFRWWVVLAVAVLSVGTAFHLRMRDLSSQSAAVSPPPPPPPPPAAASPANSGMPRRGRRRGLGLVFGSRSQHQFRLRAVH